MVAEDQERVQMLLKAMRLESAWEVNVERGLARGPSSATFPKYRCPGNKEELAED